MRDFILVICASDNVDITCRRTLKDLFSYIISSLFKKEKLEEKLKEGFAKIELYDDLNLYLLTLPYSIREVEELAKNKIDGISSFISRMMKEHGIQSCIMPSHMPNMCEFEGSIKSFFNGEFLYRSLLTNILDEILTKKGLSIGDLNITIVEGKDTEELLSVVKLLSKDLKYLTIITENKDRFENEIESIYEETGLSIMTSTDFKSGLKSADIIINMGGMKDNIPNSRINSKALVLNYGKLDFNKVTNENTFINGIEVSLPKRLLLKLDRRLFEYFKATELSEIILVHKIGININEINGISSLAITQKVSEEFKKDRYSITGFVGRRNIIKSQNISLMK